ncbi:hypothetical protein GBAR_LOCUS6157 [Geodia barretti]|uniref:Uncharacterized protein n=1 Tax=Geodia barretti TaxID=519541 RepID=A0AA35RDA4_GEOBA|nr:hypothetical protein GBAR_LOCUS6157 [Geodia barretti]
MGSKASKHPLQYIKCHLQQRLPNIRDCNGFSFRRQWKPCYQCHNLQDTPLTPVAITPYFISSCVQLHYAIIPNCLLSAFLCGVCI